MNKKDFKRFAEIMAGLQEIFTPEKPISPQKVETYFRIFQNYNIDDFQKACNALLLHKKISTFPLPAEIIEVIEGNENDKALLAFHKFKKAKDQYGAYPSIVFDDKTIHMVVNAMGGWEDVCMIPESEWKYKRKEWLDLYKAFLHTPARYPERLIGIFEHQNNLNGYDIKPKPILIGENQKDDVYYISAEK